MAPTGGKRQVHSDYFRCGIGFILAILITLPPSIHLSKQFQESTAVGHGRDTALTKETSTFDSWVSSYSFSTPIEPVIKQPEIVTQASTYVKIFF